MVRLVVALFVVSTLHGSNTYAQQRQTGARGVGTAQGNIGVGNATLGNQFGTTGISNGLSGNNLGTNFGNGSFGTGSNIGANSTSNRGISSFGNTNNSGAFGGTQTSQNGAGTNGINALNPNTGSGVFGTSNPFTPQSGSTNTTGTAGRNGARTGLNNRSLFGQQGFGGLNALGALNAGQQRNPGTIQPSLQLGFIPPSRSTEDVAASLQSHIKGTVNKQPRLADAKPELREVEASVGIGGVVTLSGRVPTESARRLAENMVRLEPGVRKIVNDLQVANRAD